VKGKIPRLLIYPGKGKKDPQRAQRVWKRVLREGIEKKNNITQRVVLRESDLGALRSLIFTQQRGRSRKDLGKQGGEQGTVWPERICQMMRYGRGVVQHRGDKNADGCNG